MMDWILRRLGRKVRGKDGWQIVLAASALFIFIAVGSVGAGVPVPTKDGAIGGKAWCDLNEDGKRQKGDQLLPDVNVTLQKVEEDGTLTDVATTKTNAKGRYKFKQLLLGTYVVVFDDNGLSFTQPNKGNDKRDSDVIDIQAGVGATGEIHLDANDPTNYSTDAGYVDCDTGGQPDKGAIGGKAWCDENEDGMRQDTESFLPGVEVTLKEVLSDGQYKLVATATTDAQGNYKFENLPLGSYVVIFDENNLSFTSPNIGDDCKDSDVVKQLDGLYCTDHIILNANNPTSLCTDAGYIGCAPKNGVIAGKAWCDVNEDGKRQEDELLLPTVGVTLIRVLPDGQHETVVTTTTDAQGSYKFENLPLGTYLVAFDDNGSSFTGADLADDCMDSDVIDQSGGKGTTDQIVLDADNPTSPCNDAGYLDDCVPTNGVISGRAWCDLDEDGKRQQSDTFLPDVAVTLNKKLPDGQLEVVTTTTTDDQGRYQFTELPLGAYVVAFDDNDLDFTTQDAAGDCMDSDVVDKQGGEGITAAIVLDAQGPTSTCTDAGYVGCGPTEPCIETIHHDVPLIYDKYRKFMRTGVWIKWEQLEALGVGLPHQYDRADEDFNNKMEVIEGDFTELRQELTNLGAKWVRLVAEGSWSWLQLRIDAPTSSDDWHTDMFNPEYVSQLPPTLKFTIKIVYLGEEKEVCLDVPYYFSHQRISSPIALDTDGSGAVERITGEFDFDFAANGEPVKATEWFAPSEGILVDTRIAGPMTGAHLFGDMGGRYADGYAKLAKLDANGDGAVSGAELAGLAIWTDTNSNAIADEGEISSLAAHRIVSLSTRHMGYVSAVTLADGATMVAEDLWFPVVLPPPPAQPVAAPVSVKAPALGLGGAMLLALLIVTVRRWRQVSVPEAA